MAHFIFISLTQDDNNRAELEKILMNGIKIDTYEVDEINKEIERYNSLISENSIKLDRLLNVYLEKLINPSEYESMHRELSDKIELYKLEKEDLEKRLKRLEPPELKIERAKQSVRRLLDFNYNGIDDRLIEEVVEKIVVHKDWFEWKLIFVEEPFKLRIKGNLKEHFIEEFK